MKLHSGIKEHTLNWSQLSYHDKNLGGVTLPILPEHFHTIGTYIIRMPLIGYFYIGSSSHVYTRLKDHRTTLCKGKHHQKKFQRLFDVSNYLEVTVFKTQTIQESLELEQQLLDLNINDPFLINIAKNVKKPGLGLFPTDETKQKISQSMMGIKKSDEHRKKISISKKGKPLKQSHIEKIKKSKTGSKASDTTKQKMSLSRIGKTHTFESKNKIALIAQKRWNDPNYRKRMIEAINKRQMPNDFIEKLKDRLKGNKYFSGKTHSEKTKILLREKNKCIKKSQESIAKMKATKHRNNHQKRLNGISFPKSNSVIINGVQYPSINYASEQLKICAETIRKRVLNISDKFNEWKYA